MKRAIFRPWGERGQDTGESEIRGLKREKRRRKMRQSPYSAQNDPVDHSE